MNFGSKHNELKSPKVDLYLFGATKGKDKQFFIDWQKKYHEQGSRLRKNKELNEETNIKKI
jgi:hypothetical protein